MKLIIVRHGETIENKKGIIMGHLPGKLSETGIEQAKKLGLRLKDEKIDYIYSSDLARAKDTAEEIIKFHPNIPIKFVQELREKNLGELQGKSKKELGMTGEKWSLVSANPKNGENIEELFQRARNFVDNILNTHPKKNILFVCHNGIKKALVCVIVGKEAKDIPSIENFKNTSVSIFEIDGDKKHKIHLLNCANHLEK
jgi:broad specificity phosphatase PhoE